MPTVSSKWKVTKKKKKKEIQFIGQPTYLLSYKQGSQAIGQFPKKLARLWAHQAVIPLARQPTCLTSDKSFPSSIVSPGNNNNNNKTKKLKKKSEKKLFSGKCVLVEKLWSGQEPILSEVLQQTPLPEAWNNYKTLWMPKGRYTLEIRSIVLKDQPMRWDSSRIQKASHRWTEAYPPCNGTPLNKEILLLIFSLPATAFTHGTKALGKFCL